MASEEIFRFVNVRPAKRILAVRLKKRFAVFSKADKSPLHLDISKLHGEDARDKATELARQKITSTKIDVDEFITLTKAVQSAVSCSKVSEIKAEIQKCLKQSISVYLDRETVRILRTTLWDLLYAHTLVPEENAENRDTVFEGIRAFHFIETINETDDNEEIRSFGDLTVIIPLIPKDLIPKAPTSFQDTSNEVTDKILNEFEKIYRQVTSIDTAIHEIRNGDRIIVAKTNRLSLASLEDTPVDVPSTHILPTSTIAVELPTTPGLSLPDTPTPVAPYRSGNCVRHTDVLRLDSPA